MRNHRCHLRWLLPTVLVPLAMVLLWSRVWLGQSHQDEAAAKFRIGGVSAQGSGNPINTELRLNFALEELQHQGGRQGGRQVPFGHLAKHTCFHRIPILGD